MNKEQTKFQKEWDEINVREKELMEAIGRAKTLEDKTFLVDEGQRLAIRKAILHLNFMQYENIAKMVGLDKIDEFGRPKAVRLPPRAKARGFRRVS